MATAVYTSLFLAAFLAATLLPAQSEAVLVGMILHDAGPVWALVTVATIGNVLGSLVNWGLGRSIERFRHRRWFPVGELELERAQRWYARFGVWSLLLAFLPIIGDPLTLVAGMMRVSLGRFLGLVVISKAGRYLALAAVTLGLFR